MYKICTRIKPSTISMITSVPEFNEVIKNYNGHIDDEKVYELLSEKCKEMETNGNDLSDVRRVMRRILRDLTSNSCT